MSDLASISDAAAGVTRNGTARRPAAGIGDDQTPAVRALAPHRTHPG